MLIRLTAIALAASLSLVAGSTLGLGQPGQPERQRSRASTNEHEAPIQQVQARQRQTFAVLKGAPRQAPPVIRDSLQSEHGHGLNAALARRTRLTLSGHWAWIVPGRDFLCIFIKRSFGTTSACDTTSGAISDGVGFAIIYRGHNPHVDAIGLVRDGVTWMHGAPVVRNAYEYEAARLAR
jgi:hypothetical protein